MKGSLNLTAYFDQVTDRPVLTDEQRKQPALLRPAVQAQVLSKLNNDQVGICPHCSGKMVESKINVGRLQGLLPVLLCANDRYVAPMKTETA